MSTVMYTANNSPDELLHAYIDDELDAELEPQLFSQLAADCDLRSRLRQLRGLRAEARRFGAVSEPPPELTLAVFDRLGFVPSASNKAAGLLGASLLFRHAWAPVASAAAAAFLTATIIFGLQGTLNDNSTPALADQGQTASETVVSAADTPSASAMNSENSPAAMQQSGSPNTQKLAEPQPSSSTGGLSRTMARNAVAETPDNAVVSTASVDAATPSAVVKPGDDAAVLQNESPIQTMGTSIASSTQPDSKVASSATHTEDPIVEHESGSSAAISETSPFASARSTPIVLAQQGLPGQDVVDTRKYFPMLDAGPGLSFFSVELRGVSAASFPNVTIGSQSDPWMANMAVAVYYGEEQDDFGIEYGQEPFSQHYSGMEFGKAVRYEQNLLTSWLLAGYRHRFTPLQALGSIEPYFSTSLGATLEAWPLARAGVGLMYMPDRRVRFQLGIEGSLLAYPYQDKWFTSKRAGLTYGISVLL